MTTKQPQNDMSFLGHLFTVAASDLERKQKQKQHSPKRPALLAPRPQATSPAPSSPASANATPVSPSSSIKSAVSAPTTKTMSSAADFLEQQYQHEQQRRLHEYGHDHQDHEHITSTATPPQRRQAAAQPLSHIPIEIVDNDQCIRIRLDLAAKTSDISIQVQRERILVIKGVRMVPCPEEDSASSSVSDDDDSRSNPQEHTTTTVALARHEFVRRYCVDTNTVDIQKLQANLSGPNGSILTIWAPKKSVLRAIDTTIQHVPILRRKSMETPTTTEEQEDCQMGFVAPTTARMSRHNHHEDQDPKMVSRTNSAASSSFTTKRSHSSSSYGSSSVSSSSHSGDDCAHSIDNTTPNKRRKLNQHHSTASESYTN